MALQQQDLEDSMQSYVTMLSSSSAVGAREIIRSTAQQLFDSYKDDKEAITKKLNALTQAEEEASLTLLALENAKTKMLEELDAVEREVQKQQTQTLNLDSELEFLQRELKGLQESEQEMQALEQEVDEDTTEIIPSAIYQAQLYHKVTQMRLEMDKDNPEILKGAHYGKDLASPINIDTSILSPSEISDKLWGLVSTAWN